MIDEYSLREKVLDDEISLEEYERKVQIDPSIREADYLCIIFHAIEKIKELKAELQAVKDELDSFGLGSSEAFIFKGLFQ